MPKLPECDRCQFYGRNPHLICAIHPTGVEDEHCLDFREDPKTRGGITEFERRFGGPVFNPSYPNAEDNWSPPGVSYYGDELICHTPRLTPQEQLEILDTHPFFTGVCPACGYHFNLQNPPEVHWDCPECGWMDESV